MVGWIDYPTTETQSLTETLSFELFSHGFFDELAALAGTREPVDFEQYFYR